MAEADALDDHDVERDQEDIGHGELAQQVQRRQGVRREQARSAEGPGRCVLAIGREDRKEGHQQRQGHVAVPQRLQAGDDRDLVQPEDRQQARAQQRREPGDGKQDQEGEVARRAAWRRATRIMRRETGGSRVRTRCGGAGTRTDVSRPRGRARTGRARRGASGRRRLEASRRAGAHRRSTSEVDRQESPAMPMASGRLRRPGAPAVAPHQHHQGDDAAEGTAQPECRAKTTMHRHGRHGLTPMARTDTAGSSDLRCQY